MELGMKHYLPEPSASPRGLFAQQLVECTLCYRPHTLLDGLLDERDKHIQVYWAGPFVGQLIGGNIGKGHNSKLQRSSI